MHHDDNEVRARFTQDIAQHQLSVLKDDGLYRHLRFKRPGSSAYWFDFITWPGHLAVTGDMGSYIFSRVSDMLEFFRHEQINPGYWQEKANAIASNCGQPAEVEEFDLDQMKQHIKQQLINWWRWEGLTTAERRELREEVQDLLDNLDDERVLAFTALSEFESTVGDREFTFQDFEYSCRRYTLHFLWICHALVWGVAQYDTWKASQPD